MTRNLNHNFFGVVQNIWFEIPLTPRIKHHEYKDHKCKQKTIRFIHHLRSMHITLEVRPTRNVVTLQFANMFQIFRYCIENGHSWNKNTIIYIYDNHICFRESWERMATKITKNHIFSHIRWNYLKTRPRLWHGAVDKVKHNIIINIVSQNSDTFIGSLMYQHDF